MNRSVAFLHTSPVHVETFDGLLRAADEAQQVRPVVGEVLQIEHVVDEALLSDARRTGIEDPGLIARVHEALGRAASGGASLVVCTCSTIGGLAEHAPTAGRFKVARIDRAMADRAVQLGPNVLIVAALASTLAPTEQLIRESAAALDAAVSIESLLVDGAWQHFEAGHVEHYLMAIVDAVRARMGDEHSIRPDVVVLAQASMAPALERLNSSGIEVLASPQLGVAAILAYLNGR